MKPKLTAHLERARNKLLQRYPRWSVCVQCTVWTFSHGGEEISYRASVVTNDSSACHSSGDQPSLSLAIAKIIELADASAEAMEEGVSGE